MNDSSPLTKLHLKDAVSDGAQITSTQEHALITLLRGQTQQRHIYPFVSPQNVANHAWHVAVILGLIDPDCTVDDLKTVLFCDVTKLRHDGISAVSKYADLERTRSPEQQESESLRRSADSDATYSSATKIAEKLADLWLFAIQYRQGNQEATTGFIKHRRSIEAMDLEAYPASIMIRDAIERWCMYGSVILREEFT